MTERDRLMGLREFLRGGYRELSEPTTIVGAGLNRLFVVIPESWQAVGPRSAHPDPEGSPPADRVVSPDAPGESTSSTGRETSADGSGGQTEAPRPSRATEPPADGSRATRVRARPVRRPSAQAVLDRAAKESRNG